MKSWMESCLRFSRPSLPVYPNQPASPSIPFCGDLVQLLAAMVLEIHQQGAMS
jgi:hypothetical protein